MDKEDKPKQDYIVMVVWYVIFLGIIPYFLYKFVSIHALKIYLPTVDLIGNIFAHSNHTISDLYTLEPKDIFSYFSLNFLSLVALLGATWHGIELAVKRKSVGPGMKMMAIMFVVTYLLPTPVIPQVMEDINAFLHEKFKKVTNLEIETSEFLGGVLVSVALVLLEAYLIHKIVK